MSNQVITYSEILDQVCNYYDEVIAPKKIKRDSSNAIYQVFKAVAKGCEIINNSADALRNRLDPKLCTQADLLETAKLVGTDPFLGKASGLYITVTNSEPQVLTLFAGEYIFDFDNELSFSFEIPQNISLEYEQETSFFAFSNTVGVHAITAINNMVIRRSDNSPIHASLIFSCQNNELLLGSSDETPVQFRNRLLYDERRQDALSELENRIKSLPYVFDARIVFNNTADAVEIDGVTLPSFMVLFMLNGVPRRELAQIFCSQTIYPTLVTDPDKFIPFEATCFIDGVIKVFYRDFGTTLYDVEVAYSFDPLLVTSAEIQEEFDKALLPFRQNNVHKPVVTEGEFYEALSKVSRPSLKVQYVKMYEDVDGTPTLVDFVSCLPTRIPKLSDITYTEA